MRTIGIRWNEKDFLFHTPHQTQAKKLSKWADSLQLPHFNVPSNPGEQITIFEAWEALIQMDCDLKYIKKVLT